MLFYKCSYKKNSKGAGEMRLKKVALGLVMVCLVFSLLLSSGITVQASDDTEKSSIKSTGVESDEPVGTIIAFAGAVAPRGYLLCDGTSYSRITYENLYYVIGTLYGSTDGATFKVPDLRGEFLRGVDNGRGVDTGRTLGSSQADEIKLHGHPFTLSIEHRGTSNVTGGLMTNGYAPQNNPSYTGTPSVNAGQQIGGFGGSETRPRNVAINFCIKY
jgi:microcystin-dependent protein